MTAHHHRIELDPKADRHDPEHLKVGTLSYTNAGLITLFLYLLWGDFCFSLMETVVPSILPLKFNSIGAPDWMMGLVVTTIPNLMNMFINPYVSFRSDRFRSRWGRRIPFLAGATPFLVVFLVLLGYSEPVGRWLHSMIPGGGGSDLVVLVCVMGVFMICFQFFNLFITSVYYYLFNDVVPHAFLARFMSLFRVVGSGAGAVYNYWGLKYANTHMQEIFLVAGLLYLIAFATMCWKVKEGEYPPPPNMGNQRGIIAAVKTYAAECFTHRFYWFFFLANACQAMTWVTGAYNLLIATKVFGFSLEFMGKVGGISGLVGLCLLYPAGIIADRFHPLRVLIAVMVAQLFVAPFYMAFVFAGRHQFSLQAAMMIQIGFSMISLPISTLAGASELPMFMRLLPQDRYGQFCSANALIRSIALSIGGVACGSFLGLMQHLHSNPDFRYRFATVWNTVFVLGYLSFLLLLHREWKRLGGLGDYKPPSAACEPEMNGDSGSECEMAS